MHTLLDVIQPFVLALSESLRVQVLWKDSDLHVDRTFADLACRHSSSFCMTVKSNPLRLARCRREDGAIEISQAILRESSDSATQSPDGSVAYVRECHGGVIDLIYPVTNGVRYLGAFFVGPWRRTDTSPEYPDTAEPHSHLPLLPVDAREKFGAILAPAARLIARTKSGSTLDVALQPSHGRIANGMEHMRVHFAAKLRAADVAAICNLSTSRFLHRFSTDVGESFSRYLLDLRLSRACELLATTELTIEIVSQQSGFASRPYFSRAFRAAHGVTPREYRRQQHTRAAR